MLFTLVLMVLTFFAVTLFGHIVHWSFHQPWSPINRPHMTHHLKLYPPSDYVSDAYRSAGRDNTVVFFAIASVPLLAVPIVLGALGVLSFFTTALIVSEMLLLGLAHDRIHDSFHVADHWLRRMPGHETWNKLHFIHHVDMTKNFGIFTFFWDQIFKTFKD